MPPSPPPPLHIHLTYTNSHLREITLPASPRPSLAAILAHVPAPTATLRYGAVAVDLPAGTTFIQFYDADQLDAILRSGLDVLRVNVTADFDEVASLRRRESWKEAQKERERIKESVGGVVSVRAVWEMMMAERGEAVEG